MLRYVMLALKNNIEFYENRTSKQIWIAGIKGSKYKHNMDTSREVKKKT